MVCLIREFARLRSEPKKLLAIKGYLSSFQHVQPQLTSSVHSQLRPHVHSESKVSIPNYPIFFDLLQ